MRRFKSLETLRDQGLAKFIKLWGNIVAVRVKNRLFYKQYKSDWEKLENLYQGKRVFLIGNGPSLNKTPLYLLKNEYTLSFNRFNIFLERLDWKPTMYMCVDGLVAEDMADEINQMTDLVDNSFFTHASLTTSTNFKKFIIEKPNVNWMLPKGVNSSFDFDLPYVNVGGSVAIAGLQVLKYLGFSEIYLIGIDMNYKIHETAEVIKGNDIKSKDNDDPNHFDPRYFGTGRKYHQPKKEIVNTILDSFKRIASDFKKTDCKVYNATVGGVLDCYARKDFSAAVGLTPEEERNLFTSLLKKKTNLDIDLNLLLDQAPQMQHSYKKSDAVIVVDSEQTGNAINELIYSHLPLGPFKDKTYFINRSSLAV